MAERMVMTYNGTPSTDPSFGIKSVMIVERQMLTPTRDRLVTVPGRDGSWDMGCDWGPGEILIRLYFKASTPQQLRENIRNIAAWLSPKEVKPLIFSDEPERQYYARRIEEILPEEAYDMGFAEFRMMHPDPWAFATTTKIAGASGENQGNRPTPCIIIATVNQQTESLRITLQQTGEFVLLQRHETRWPVTLQEGDKVQIDTSRNLVLVNNIDARAGVSVLSEYFHLPPGSFVLVPDPEPAADIQVEYRERWI